MGLTPERKFTINNQTVEEVYWAGKMVVYVNHQLCLDTYDVAVEKLIAGKQPTMKARSTPTAPKQ